MDDSRSAKEAKEMFFKIFEEHGWKQHGGGSGFVTFESPKKERTIYLFLGHEDDPHAPDVTHWVEVNCSEEFTCGGFSEESLLRQLDIRLAK